MNLTLPPAPRSGDLVATASALTVGYDNKPLFRDFDLVIKRGQRFGVVGPNGCGKSTLVRTLMGKHTPTSGTARLGASISVGYYHQTHEHLDPNDTPVTYLQRHVRQTREQSARDIAGAFGFSGDQQDQPLGIMSGGERTRAVLAALVAGGHNLLILDEPSNHLDIPSAERLEEALRQYDGTLILITHDRMLLQDTVDQLLIFEPAGIRHFIGTYREYLEAQRAQPARRAAAPDSKPPAPKPAARSKPKPKRKPKSPARPLAAISDAELEKRIVAAESALAELDAQLADPDLYRDKDRFHLVQNQRNELTTLLRPLEAEWRLRAESS